MTEDQRTALKVARDVSPAEKMFDDHPCIKAIAAALLRYEARGIERSFHHDGHRDAMIAELRRSAAELDPA